MQWRSSYLVILNGIGAKELDSANMAIFNVVNSAFIRPLPIVAPRDE